MVNEYLESMAVSKPEKYVWIDMWSKFWSTKGHAIKQFYQSSDQKGVHLNAPGKDILINTIVNSLLPESADGCKRKYSSNHSPTAGQLAKEQRLSSSPLEKVTPLLINPNCLMNTYVPRIFYTFNFFLIRLSQLPRACH